MDSPATNGGDRPKATINASPVTSAMPSKEELLMMMDKVDRDIAAVETQISALQKKQVCITSCCHCYGDTIEGKTEKCDLVACNHGFREVAFGLLKMFLVV